MSQPKPPADLRCSVFIATSLDGFIARENGALDWLPGSDGSPSGEDYGYHDFLASVDCLVIGRKTHELAQTFSPWPYSGKRVVVLSSRFTPAETPLADGVQGTSATPAELVQRLSRQGYRHAYVDGGRTIQSFLRAGLITDMVLTRIPVLIGEGIPLFASLPHDLHATHLETRSFASGFVQSRYQFLQAESGS